MPGIEPLNKNEKPKKKTKGKGRKRGLWNENCIFRNYLQEIKDLIFLSVIYVNLSINVFLLKTNLKPMNRESLKHNNEFFLSTGGPNLFNLCVQNLTIAPIII